MQQKRERWIELAELASNEQDPKKLMALVSEISQLLERKRMPPNEPPTNTSEMT